MIPLAGGDTSRGEVSTVEVEALGAVGFVLDGCVSGGGDDHRRLLRLDVKGRRDGRQLFGDVGEADFAPGEDADDVFAGEHPVWVTGHAADFAASAVRGKRGC